MFTLRYILAFLTGLILGLNFYKGVIMERLIKVTTEEERELLIKEVTEIMKDYVYGHAEVRAREIVQEMWNMDFSNEDNFKFDYDIWINGGLIKTLLAKIRRSMGS
jgi:hypothetical protein